MKYRRVAVPVPPSQKLSLRQRWGSSEKMPRSAAYQVDGSLPSFLTAAMVWGSISSTPPGSSASMTFPRIRRASWGRKTLNSP